MIFRALGISCFALLISNVTAFAQQCPFGHFLIGPIDSSVKTQGFTQNISSKLCVKIETSEQLAVFDAVATATVPDAQSLVSSIAKKVSGATPSCTARFSKSYELLISDASIQNSWGTVQVIVRGRVKPCLTRSEADLAIAIPMRAMISAQKTLSFDFDRPAVTISGYQSVLQLEVSSVIYKKLQEVKRAFKFDLASLVPKDVFLFNPSLGNSTVSYSGNSLSAQVQLTGQLTSVAATKWVRDRVSPPANTSF